MLKEGAYICLLQLAKYIEKCDKKTTMLENTMPFSARKSANNKKKMNPF